MRKDFAVQAAYFFNVVTYDDDSKIYSVNSLTFQVLQQVNFSYAAAINSILWPIIFLTIFGSVFIALRITAHCPKNQTRNGPAAGVVDDTISATPYFVNYTTSANAMRAQGGYAINLPSPPAYQDVAATGVSYPATLDEKNPADFVDIRGNADGDLATSGGAAAGSWVVMYPPNYTEPSAVDGDKKLPVVGASGGPFEDGAMAFSYPTPSSLTAGAVNDYATIASTRAPDTDLGEPGASARY